jgi:hypothetical protein
MSQENIMCIPNLLYTVQLCGRRTIPINLGCFFRCSIFGALLVWANQMRKRHVGMYPRMGEMQLL